MEGNERQLVKQHSDLDLGTKDRAYSDAGDLQIVGVGLHPMSGPDHKSVERCKFSFPVMWHIDFNQSHISYQGEADTSSRGHAMPSVGKHIPQHHGGHGNTFVMSALEQEDLAKE